MDFLNLVKERRSVRNYLSTPVPRQLLERCFEAARLAPSACNQQPWYFIAVESPSLRQKLGKAAFSGIYSLNQFALTAPVLVVVVAKASKALPEVAGFLRNTPYYLIDVAIACQHFVLAATEEGLGSCWLGWFNEKAVKKVLGLKWSEHVPAMISVGYAREKESTVAWRKKLEEIRIYK